MRERAFLYGPDGGQLGILVEPDASAAELPAVLFWNAGFLHRAGPYRSYVELARRLAGHGFATFRLDLGGLGDSRAHRDTRSNEERWLGDLRAAMDFVAGKTGAKSFVLIGLCSGADQAHPLAVADGRVAGMVMLDGYMYPTAGWRWRHLVFHLGRRLLRAGKWVNLLRRLFRKREKTPPGENPFARTFPPRALIRTELRTLLDRGTKALFIYTGGVAYCNYAGQFRDAFGAATAQHRNLQVILFPKTNHTYTLLGDRALLHDAICNWMLTTLLDRPAQPATADAETDATLAGPGRTR